MVERLRCIRERLLWPRRALDGLLDGPLDGPWAQGAFLIEAVLSPPWGLRIADEASPAIFTVLAGEAWLRHPAHPTPDRLAPGDTAFKRVRGTTPTAHRTPVETPHS